MVKDEQKVGQWKREWKCRGERGEMVPLFSLLINEKIRRGGGGHAGGGYHHQVLRLNGEFVVEPWNK